MLDEVTIKEVKKSSEKDLRKLEFNLTPILQSFQKWLLEFPKRAKGKTDGVAANPATSDKSF
jgi:hypothetical protein